MVRNNSLTVQQHVWWVCGIAAVIVALLVSRLDGPLAMGALALLAGVVALTLWPEVAILIFTFVLYANLPAIAVRFHGVPEMLGASVALLLLIPLSRSLNICREKIVVGPLFLLMVAFLLVMVAASFRARDWTVAAERIGLFLAEGILLYALTVNVIRRPATLRRVLWSLILAGSLLGALSLFQHVTGDYGRTFGGLAQRKMLSEDFEAGRIQAAREKIRTEDRAAGSIGDPNRYAQVMLVLLPLAWFLARRERSRWLRWCALAAAGLVLCGVLLSYSRGAFVAMALLLGLLVGMRYVRPSRVLLSLAVAAVFVLTFIPGYRSRVASIMGVGSLVSQGVRVEADNPTRGRITEMLAALHVFMDYPFLGVGPGQYTPFYSVEYQLNPDIAFRNLPRQRRAHNLYVELAAETGVMGLAVFLAIVGLVFSRLFRFRRRLIQDRPELADLGTAFILSLVSYLGTAMFLQLAYERYWWFLLGVVSAGLEIFERASAAQKPRPLLVSRFGAVRKPTFATGITSRNGGRVSQPCFP